MPVVQLSAGFQSLPPLPTANWALLVLLPGGWVCVRSRTLWVSPMNSPVRLRVSPAAPSPTGVFNQRLCGFISLRWSPGFLGQSWSPVVHPGLCVHKCGAVRSVSWCLASSASCGLI